MGDHPIVTLIRGKLADPGTPFTLMADLEAQTGRGDEVAAAVAVSEVIRLTRLEPGCVAYDFYRDCDSPERFVMHERWRDLAALTAHLTTAHFTAVGAALSGLLAAAPGIRVLIPAGEQE